MGKKQKPSQQRRGVVTGQPGKQPYGKGTVLQRRPPRQPGR